MCDFTLGSSWTVTYVIYHISLLLFSHLDRSQLLKEKQAREEAERAYRENEAKLKAYEADAAKARAGKLTMIPVQNKIKMISAFSLFN